MLRKYIQQYITSIIIVQLLIYIIMNNKSINSLKILSFNLFIKMFTILTYTI